LGAEVVMGLHDVSREEARAAARAPYSASAEALLELGLMCSLGMDGEPDLVAAHKWLSLSAMKGNAAARVCRRELACEMTVSELAEAQRQAGAWIVPHT
jgi:TPR repeat protein